MIKIKHFLDPVEPNDGQRIWVEPIGLTRELRQWCKIDHVLTHLGPPMEPWKLLEQNPESYEYFRARYHDFLARSPYKAALQSLACAGMREDFTLIHQGEDACRNSAVAMYEFLAELEAYCKPDPE